MGSEEPELHPEMLLESRNDKARQWAKKAEGVFRFYSGLSLAGRRD